MLLLVVHEWVEELARRPWEEDHAGYTLVALKAKVELACRCRAQALGRLPVVIGGQDCHAKELGAFTGDLSARCWRMAWCS